jgi:hypothetical protein
MLWRDGFGNICLHTNIFNVIDQLLKLTQSLNTLNKRKPLKKVSSVYYYYIVSSVQYYYNKFKFDCNFIIAYVNVYVLDCPVFVLVSLK